jgi:hypothetical protein
MKAVRANAAGSSTSPTRSAGSLSAAICPLMRNTPDRASSTSRFVSSPAATVSTSFSTVYAAVLGRQSICAASPELVGVVVISIRFSFTQMGDINPSGHSEYGSNSRSSITTSP